MDRREDAAAVIVHLDPCLSDELDATKEPGLIRFLAGRQLRFCNKGQLSSHHGGFFDRSSPAPC
jgi:hypothetical protein